MVRVGHSTQASRTLAIVDIYCSSVLRVYSELRRLDDMPLEGHRQHEWSDGYRPRILTRRLRYRGKGDDESLELPGPVAPVSLAVSQAVVELSPASQFKGES